MKLFLVTCIALSNSVFASDRDKQVKDYCKDLVGKTNDKGLHDYCKSHGYYVNTDKKGNDNSGSNSTGGGNRGADNGKGGR